MPFAPFFPSLRPETVRKLQPPRRLNGITPSSRPSTNVAYTPARKTDPIYLPNSPLCSRNACQYLHDDLFSDYSSISVKVFRKKVDACYAEVKEYLDRQAAEKRQAERKREQAVKDQESAEEARKQARRASQAEQTRTSSTPASQGPANNPTVIPPSQQTGQPYSVGSMRVPDTPQAEQARQAAKEREQKELANRLLTKWPIRLVNRARAHPRTNRQQHRTD